MSCGEQAGHAVERWACIIIVSYLDCPGMQRHAYLERAYLRGPRLCKEGALRIESGLQGLSSGGEGRAERITFCTKNVAAISLYSLAKDRIMALNGCSHSL